MGDVTKAVVPAAGRGTRFLPFSKAVPKELAPIVTTPSIEFVLREAAACGVQDLLVVLGPGKDEIGDYLRAAPELEQALGDDTAALALIRRAPELMRYHEVLQKQPRGLGDAIAHAEQFAGGEPFAVLLPDDLIDDRDDLLQKMFAVQAEHGGAVLALLDVPRADVRMYGCVTPAPGADLSADVVPLVDLVEKPDPSEAPSTLAIIGRYVLPPEIFGALRQTEPGAKGEIQVTDAIRRLAHDGVPVHGVVFRGRRYDTGNRLDYLKTVVQLAQRHPEIGDEFGAWLREHVGGTG
jgi:UTP--glucose-1-phosphate uridylyltransferase